MSCVTYGRGSLGFVLWVAASKLWYVRMYDRTRNELHRDVTKYNTLEMIGLYGQRWISLNDTNVTTVLRTIRMRHKRFKIGKDNVVLWVSLHSRDLHFKKVKSLYTATCIAKISGDRIQILLFYTSTLGKTTTWYSGASKFFARFNSNRVKFYNHCQGCDCLKW